jgi:thiopurine S-methyltransferase
VNVDFWKARWVQGRIGFHRDDVQPHLTAHISRWLNVAPGQAKPLSGLRLLVPLCGKSVDLWWLAQQGARVTGVEFVEQAARAFFQEHSLQCSVDEVHGVKVLRSLERDLAVEIYVADFLSTSPDVLGSFDGVYDRAGLIAVEPAVRTNYAAQLAALSRPKGRLLLVTFEHHAGSGPPHSVPPSETRRLLDADFTLELVATHHLDEARYQAFGPTHEHIWVGTRQGLSHPSFTREPHGNA